jgi:YD repeat-containing protein
MQHVKKIIPFLLIILLTTLTLSLPAQAKTTYRYDNLGRLIEAKYDSGKTVTYTYDASGNITAVATTSTAPTAFFTGAILYQPSPRPAAISLQDSLGNSYHIDTATDGSYALTIPTPQEGARYTLKVTKPGYLSYTVRNLDLANWEDEKTIDIRQLAGDVNGDGIVNAVDLTCLLSEFNREPLKFEDADIDGNGIVNAADLTYLLAGFNKRDVEIGD